MINIILWTGVDMFRQEMKKMTKSKRKVGHGLLNSFINKVPFEMHLPGYQYCGPGTNLKKRLARGDPGINGLDAACKLHDIAYDQYHDGKERIKADKQLAKSALKRVIAKDAGIGERAYALAVAAAMAGKVGVSKLGSGLPKRKKKKTILTEKKHQKRKTSKKVRTSFSSVIKSVKEKMKKFDPSSMNAAVNVALSHVKEMKRSKNITKPRIIPLPKTGGLLPLIPIFAGLSALGALAGGASSVIRTIDEAKQARAALGESEKHNRMMEAIAIGKSTKGSGLYLSPYKKGLGLYLKPYKSSKNF